MANDWLTPAIFATALWGVWGIFSKLAAEALPWPTVIAWGAVGSFFVLVAVLLTQKFELAANLPAVWAVLGGLTGVAGAVFFYVALARGTASVIVPLTALYPGITALLAIFLLKEPISASQTVGIILALIAVVLMSL